MNSDEREERLKQIRERRAAMYFPSGVATGQWADIDFLLASMNDVVRPRIADAVDKAVDLGATAMRDLCVEKVRAKIHDLSRTAIAAEQNAPAIDLLIEVREDLKSLTLDQVQENK